MDQYEALDTWVRTLYGRCTGYVELTCIRTQNERRKVIASHVKAEDWDTTACLQLAELQDVYLGCCTVKTPPDRNRRGSYKDRLEMPGLWLDIDIGNLGHKPSGDGLGHFADLGHALRTLESCGFPVPTAIIHSGGGIYPWWLFPTPLVLEPDARRDSAQALSDKWNTHASAVARAQGLKIDMVSDLPRFLRPPGTVNLKAGQRRETSLLTFDPDLRYDPNDLWTLVAGVEVGTRSVPASSGSGSSEDGEGSEGGLADALRGCAWRDILEPAGWTYSGRRGGEHGEHEAWTRPGKDPSEGDSALAAPDVLTVFSDSTGLPSGRGQRLTKLRVFAHLHFNGSEAAALQDLVHAVSTGETDAPWPAEALRYAEDSVGMDLEFVKRHMTDERRDQLEFVQKSRRRILTRDADGRLWSTSRGSGYRA